MTMPPAGPMFPDFPPEPLPEDDAPPLEPLELPEVVDREEEEELPPPIMPLAEGRREGFTTWLDQQVTGILSKHGEIERFYKDIEEAYRALPGPDTGFPFRGHATEQVPVVAATVDPIHARIDLGVNKQDPVLRVRALRDDTVEIAKDLEPWINFRRRHLLRMHQLSSPAFLECVKLGTYIAKTTYEMEEYPVKAWSKVDGKWKATQVMRKRRGAKVTYPSASDVFWTSGWTDARTIPLIVERRSWTVDELVAASAGDDPRFDPEAVQKVIAAARPGRTLIETTRDEQNKDAPSAYDERVELLEAWGLYDFDQDPLDRLAGRKPATPFVVTYHRDSMEILELRPNYYFHQRHPYTIVPYSEVNGNLRGRGAGEMSLPFQRAVTKWKRMSQDNAYLANIRMWATRKGLMKELRLDMFAGRNVPLDDPQKDIRELRMSDTYPSTEREVQYLDQMNQRLTGSSDYLSGNESPVVGSRATATGTLAVIQEGTRRVESTLENFRTGEADIAMKCLSFDIQFGPGDALDAAVDAAAAQRLRAWFDQTDVDDLDGQIAIELSATDAGGSRSAQQQTLMAVQQMIAQFNDKTFQMAGQVLQSPPPIAQLILANHEAERSILIKLLAKQEFPDANDLLPRLDDYVAPPPPAPPPGPPPAGGGGPAPGGPGGMAGGPGDAGLPAPGGGPVDAGGLPPTGVGGIDRVSANVERAFGGPV